MFTERNFGLAAMHYRKGLVQCDYWFPEGDEEDAVYDGLKAKLHLNLAACKLEQREWDEVECRTVFSNVLSSSRKSCAFRVVEI